MHTEVPCDDCEARSEKLRALGFQVLGCQPLPGRPGICTLAFAEGPAAAASPDAEAVPAAMPAVLTPSQVAAAQAIVNIFETSQVLGDYGQVTLIEGDTGHLTFGRSQTTLGSGNLGRMLQQYCANAGAVFGARLTPFLPRMAAIDLTLDQDTRLHNLLRATADDPVMRETQDRFFDQTYWQPAQRAAARLGIVSPLGTAVVYDSHVHGSWGALRDRTHAAVGQPQAVGERRWITAYVQTRRQWLAQHPRNDLRATVYRMDAFQRLIANGMWALPLPLVVRGSEISALSLSQLPRGCYDGPPPGSRALALTTPLTRGLDVRRVQLALSDRGVDILADGLYGQTSVQRVKGFQQQQGLPASGVLDAALVATLVG